SSDLGFHQQIERCCVRRQIDCQNGPVIKYRRILGEEFIELGNPLAERRRESQTIAGAQLEALFIEVISRCDNPLEYQLVILQARLQLESFGHQQKFIVRSQDAGAEGTLLRSEDILRLTCG